MDLYNLIQQIPYITVLLVGVTFVFQVFLGGLVTLEADVEDAQRDEFRRAIVLENTLSAEYTRLEVSSSTNLYDFSKRRAVLPVEFFIHNLDYMDRNGKLTDNVLGYRVKDGHCYIPRVAGLDGENYAFYVKPMYDQEKLAKREPRLLHCTNPYPITGVTSQSPALLLRAGCDNVRLPVRIFVYEVLDEEEIPTSYRVGPGPEVGETGPNPDGSVPQDGYAGFVPEDEEGSLEGCKPLREGDYLEGDAT